MSDLDDQVGPASDLLREEGLDAAATAERERIMGVIARAAAALAACDLGTIATVSPWIEKGRTPPGFHRVGRLNILADLREIDGAVLRARSILAEVAGPDPATRPG